MGSMGHLPEQFHDWDAQMTSLESYISHRERFRGFGRHLASYQWTVWCRSKSSCQTEFDIGGVFSTLVFLLLKCLGWYPSRNVIISNQKNWGLGPMKIVHGLFMSSSEIYDPLSLRPSPVYPLKGNLMSFESESDCYTSTDRTRKVSII